MARYHKNEAVKVNYIALKKTTGLTDVSMVVFDPSGAVFATVAMAEIVPPSGYTSGGMYYGSFTPTADGQYRVRITSIVNGDDVQKAFEIDDYDIDDVKAQTQSIENKVDIIDGNVTAIKAKTDNLPADTAATLAAIKSVVDSIEAQINPGGYIL